ncbi:MAG: type III-B CRISPR module RAMP protein Cmr4 [Clostridium argentinense]|nr:type III-B CRISPR module RAMP protein Cmr4 [Clostridium argentinense]
MYKNKETIYIKAISPIHAGSGQSLTSVDMPIQRESHSNIPKIEGSTLKGSIKHNVYHKLGFNKENVEKEKKQEYTTFEKAFGPEENGEKSSSAIGITDAKLLLFPIRSATDIYKLITCPYVLKRWKEETNQYFENSILDNLNDGSCIVNNNVTLLDKDRVMLEEYIFEAYKQDLSSLFDKILEESQKNKIVILPDSDFIDMVTMYTEVITRNRIDIETGTAQGTGLFSEEYLPAETVMYFSVLQSAFYKGEEKEALKYFNKNLGEIFQVGGNETIGKGIVKVLNYDLLEGVTK